jgi:hypothetical protein
MQVILDYDGQVTNGVVPHCPDHGEEDMSNLRFQLLALLLVMLALAACGGANQAPPQPEATIAPIVLTDDLSKIDLCQAIPQEVIAAALGRKLVSPPQHFEYYETSGSTGCQYDAGKSSSGDALFAYVALTPPEVYAQQSPYKNQAVSGIGDAAYFNNGADARQLWGKIGEKAALVVAIGDAPNEDGLKTIAQLVVAAIQK